MQRVAISVKSRGLSFDISFALGVQHHQIGALEEADPRRLGAGRKTDTRQPEVRVRTIPPRHGDQKPARPGRRRFTICPCWMSWGSSD